MVEYSADKNNHIRVFGYLLTIQSTLCIWFVLFYFVLFCIVWLCSSVVYCTVLYYSVLHFIVLQCFVLYCIVLYCTVILTTVNIYISLNMQIKLVLQIWAEQRLLAFLVTNTAAAFSFNTPYHHIWQLTIVMHVNTLLDLFPTAQVNNRALKKVATQETKEHFNRSGALLRYGAGKWVDTLTSREEGTFLTITKQGCFLYAC